MSFSPRKNKYSIQSIQLTRRRLPFIRLHHGCGLFAILFAAVMGCGHESQAMSLTSMPGMNSPAVSKDAPMSDVAVHGFAVVGTWIYLSHLPMFHAPHDYQMIMSATFDPAGAAAYKKVRDGHPEQLVTLVPEPFSLVEMIAHPKAFHADLYKGHFERGGVIVAKNILVTPFQIVHAHHLGDPNPNPTYGIGFGGKMEYFNAHFITAPPDYDEITLETPGEIKKVIYHEEDDLKN